MQEYLFSHFSMAGYDGFLKDVSITFIDKNDPSDPLRREDYRRKATEKQLNRNCDTQSAQTTITPIQSS